MSVTDRGSGENLMLWGADLERQRMVIEEDWPAFIETYSRPLSPRLNTPEMWDFYVEQHRIFEYANLGTRKRIERTVQMVGEDVSEVMDVAAGYGLVLGELVKKLPGIELNAIDFSPKSIEMLRRTYVGNFQAMSLLDVLRHGDGRSFQCVLCLETMEHIDCFETFAAWRALRSFVREDGVLIVSVPVSESLKASSMLCPCCGAVINPNGHVREYTGEILEAELNMMGFRVVQSDDSVENCFIAKARVDWESN